MSRPNFLPDSQARSAQDPVLPPWALPSEAWPCQHPAGAAASGHDLSAALILAQPLLCALSPDLADWLAGRAILRRQARTALLAQQGQVDRAFHTVLTGTVHLVRQGDTGRSLLLAHLGPGEHFGVRSLIDGKPRGSAARCVGATDLLVVSAADFLRCLDNSASLRQALLQDLSQQVRRKNRRIEMLALNDVQGCVLRELHGASVLHQGQRIVPGPITRQALADGIGASREMVSRVFRDLTRSGRIRQMQDGSLLLDTTAA